MRNWIQDEFILKLFIMVFFNLSPGFMEKVIACIKGLEIIAKNDGTNTDLMFVNFLFKFARSDAPELKRPWGADPTFTPPKKDDTG